MIDFTYLSLGAGVQSSTLAEMIVEGEYPAVDVAIFADTGDEPAYVYEQVDYLKRRLGSVDVPSTIVRNGDIVSDAMAEDRRFAAMPVFTLHGGEIGGMRRQCTREYKIVPIERYVRQQLLDKGKAKQFENGAIHINRGVRVVCLLGLSLDEVARMKPNPHKWIENRWPLIEMRMSRHDCVRWLRDHNLPVPKKSSCRVCPYHSDAYWRNARDERPADWQHAVEFDAFLRSGRSSRLVATARGELFLHRQCVPLNEVDLSTPQDRGQLELFDTLCESGYCFT